MVGALQQDSSYFLTGTNLSRYDRFLAYSSRRSSESDRADALGKLGVAYGVGMVLGPMIGGVVTQRFSPQIAALLAAAVSSLCVLLVLRFVPSRTKKKLLEDDASVSTSSSASGPGNVRVLVKLLENPRIRFLLIIRVVTGVPLGVFQSMFSRVSIDAFQVDAKDSGYVLSYVGLLSLVMQGFGVGFMTKRFDDDSLLKIGACALIPYYLGLAAMSSFYQVHF